LSRRERLDDWRTKIAVIALCVLGAWAAYSREPAPLGYLAMAAAFALPWEASSVWGLDRLLVRAIGFGVAIGLPWALEYGIDARIPALILAQGTATTFAASLVWEVILKRVFRRRLSRSKTTP